MRRLGLGAFLVLLASGCAGQKAATSAPVAPSRARSHALAAADDPAPDREEPRAHADGPWIGGAAASAYMLPGGGEELFGVWVDVPATTSDIHVPTALSLAIDTSGSMRGDKIAHARDAARRLVEELDDGDLVSLVAFSDGARVLVPPTTIDAQSRRRILNLVEELSADGGTAMLDGLQTAQSQLWRAPSTHLVRRVVMISDGKATVGPSSTDVLGQVAEAGMQQGIQVTSLGVGLDYDEATLDALAIRSSGRLYHLEHTAEMASIVEREMGLLQATAAADVQVEIVPAPGVTLVGIDAVRSVPTAEGIGVPLGDMFAGQHRELLVRARVDPTALGRHTLASLRFHFRDPHRDGIARVQEAVIDATVTDDPAQVAAHTDPRTQSIIAMREAAVLAMSASAEANAGNLAVASRSLDRAESSLRKKARKTKDTATKRKLLYQAERFGAAKRDLAKASSAPAPARARASRATALDLNDAAMEADGF